MKSSFTRIIIICLINFVLNYLMLFPLGLFKYLETSDLLMFSLTGIVISAIPGLVTLIFYKLIDGKPIRSLNFRFNRKDVSFSIAIMSVTILLFLFLITVFSWNGIISVTWNIGTFSNIHFYLSFLWVFIAWFTAALYEEILFRGYFYSNLQFLSTKNLYLVSSIIFMIFHIFKGLDPISMLLLTIMGCMFLYVYLKSGSLLPGTFAHLIFNLSSSHLTGKNDIAILKYTGDLGIYHLVIIAFYMMTVLILTKIFYRSK